jgi:hypothetical protein
MRMEMMKLGQSQPRPHAPALEQSATPARLIQGEDAWSLAFRHTSDDPDAGEDLKAITLPTEN